MKSIISFLRSIVPLCLSLTAVNAETVLTPETTYSGTLSVPGESHTYTFTGAPGQIIYLDSQDNDGINASLTLLSPEGVVLYSRNDDQDSGTLLLSEPGTYRLTADGFGSVTGTYDFRLLDLAHAAPITPGAALDGQLNPPLACNVYKFSGTRGQRLNLQAISAASAQARWELLSPANAVLASGQINQSLGAVTLPVSGTYCVLVSGSASGVTPFTFRILLSDVSDGPVAAGGFGVSHSGNIAAGQTNSFDITGSAGLPVYFDSLDASGQLLAVDLIDPTGGVVFSGSETADAGPIVLPRSGTYKLQVRSYNGTASGNYNFRLLDLTTSAALPLNTVVSNAFASAYLTDIRQFTATNGQRFFYDGIDSDNDNVTIKLFGPDGQAAISGNSDVDRGPFTLPVSGTYYLALLNGLSTTPNYVFQLMVADGQPALPQDTNIVVNLPAYTASLYQLAGSAGERLYFDAKGVNAPGASWALYRQDNAVVASAGLNGDFEVTLASAGQYLLVYATGNNSISTTNQVGTFDITTNALSLDAAVSGAIARPGNQVVYTFNGTAGQRVYFDSLGATNGINVKLLSPTGLLVFSGSANNDTSPNSLPETGAYSLVFDASTDAVGAFDFQLLDIGSKPALPLNSDLAGVLPSKTALVYQLAGTAGEQIFFNAKNTIPNGATWTLYRPDNSPVDGRILSSDFEVTLGEAGQYVVVFSGGANPATYTNQVNTFTATTEALNLNAPTNGMLVNPGDQISFTFNGTAGQRIFFDSLGADVGINFSMVSPAGVRVMSGSAANDQGPQTLQENGTYTLTFDGTGDYLGSLAFQLIDVGGQAVLPLNTDLVGTLPARQAVIYRLPTTAGARLYFDAKGVSTPGAYWLLYRPDDAQVDGRALSGDFEPPLDQTGDYVLVLSGGTASVNYTNQANTFTFTTNALALNSISNNVIARPGDQLYYTFTGSTGQRLYYDSRQTNNSSVTAKLLSPTGQSVLAVAAAGDSGPVTLLEDGTYSLVFDGTGDATAAVAFNLLNLSDAPSIGLGPLSDTLADQTQARLYALAGTAGQRLNLQHVSFSDSHAVWTLIGTSDQSLGSRIINADLGVLTLPASGAYFLLVAGNGSGASPLSFQVNIADVTDPSPGATNGFGVEHAGTIGAAETNTFSISAPAGLPVYFDSLDASGQLLVVDLIGPDGQSVFSVYETGDGGPYILPRSGTYSLRVRGYNGTASGNYDFRLLDLTTSPALPLDTVLSNGLGAAYQTHVYQISSPAGQELFYDALTNDSNPNSIAAEFEDAAGASLWNSGNFQNDSPPIIIPHAETRYLFLRGLKSPSSPYSLQMMDLASHSPLPLNAPATNSLAAYESLLYRYSGTAGQHLYFHGRSGNPSGSWYLYAPRSTVVVGSAGLSGDFEVTLPATGTYAALLRNTSGTAGTNVFEVDDFTYVTNSYVLGTAVVDTINGPGEQRMYTFTGTAGQRLYYDGLTNDPPSPNVISASLVNPNGSLEGPISGRFSTDRGPFTLQHSGTYTLIIDGNGAGTGLYGFRLLDLASQPVLPINAAVTNSLPAYQALVYRYPGAADERLYFDGIPGNPNGTWAMFAPDNNALPGGTSLAADMELTLPTNGLYALVLNNYSGNGGTNVFQDNSFSLFANAYTLGSAVATAINMPGEQRSYTFTGTVGQRLFYDALTNVSGYTINAQLINPHGVAEGPIAGNFVNDHGPFSLQYSGVYTLIFDGSATSTGPFAFRLLDVASQPVLPLNASVTNSLRGYESVLYRYSGLPGQQLYLDGQSPNPGGSWALFDPDNTSMGSAGLTGDLEVQLPLSGNYTLVLSTYSGNEGTNVFAANPFNTGAPLLINRSPVLAPIPLQLTGEATPLTFTATASDADGDSLTFSLDPGGAGGTIGAASGVFNWSPPVTGFSVVTNVVVRVSDNGNPPLSSAQIVTIEIIAGPVMLTVHRDDTGATVFWRSAPGKHYHLEFKNTLLDAAWTRIGSDIPATDFISSELDATAGTNATRYYRVQLLDPD